MSHLMIMSKYTDIEVLSGEEIVDILDLRPGCRLVLKDGDFAIIDQGETTTLQFGEYYETLHNYTGTNNQTNKINKSRALTEDDLRKFLLLDEN